MKITRLKIRNLFGIREYDSNGKCIELNGKNGVGKSGVIDAIKYALTAKSERQYLVLDGETEGEVLIETDSGLRINRKPRTNKADYKSIRQNGDPGEKTEAFLRDIFTELQLNPVEFAAMDPKEQNRIILDLIDFKWDMNWIKEQFGEIPPEVNYEQNILCVMHDIQAEEGYYFKKRQDINREIKDKNAVISDIGKVLPAEYDAKKWEAVSLGEIYTKIETIRNNNEWIERAKNAVKNKEGKIRGFEAEYEISRNAIDKETSSTRNSLEKQIVELENKVKEYRKELETLEEKKISKLEIAKKTYEAKIGELEGEVKQYEDLAKQEPAAYADLQDEVTHAEKMKSHINEYNRMVDLQAKVQELIKQSESLTGKIEKARSLPGEILAVSKIPVEGLTIKDGIPLINGLPISNLSEGEKLELCISVAVQNESALQMLLIDGVERLATEKRENVYNRLKEKGVQFIATRTTDDEALTVVEL